MLAGVACSVTCENSGPPRILAPVKLPQPDVCRTRMQAKAAISAAFYADTALEALATVSQEQSAAGDGDGEGDPNGLSAEARVRRTAISIRDRRQQSIRNSIRSSQQRQFRERSAQRCFQRGARMGVVALVGLVWSAFVWRRSRL